jgi:hypothetical protein
MLMPLQVRSLVRVAAMLSHSVLAVHVARSAQARSVVVVGAAVCHCESVHVETVAQTRFSKIDGAISSYSD